MYSYGHVTEAMKTASADRMQVFINDLQNVYWYNSGKIVVRKKRALDFSRALTCGKQDLNLQVRTYT